MDKDKATQIAAIFLVRYYTVLSKSPENLKNFYHDRSSFTRRSIGNDKSQSVVGIDNIHNYVMEQGLLGSQVSIKTIDCQQSLNDGLFISCTGILQKDGEQSNIFHSFFLEKSQPSESSKNGESFYVLNDILVTGEKEELTLTSENSPDEATEDHIGEAEEITNQITTEEPNGDHIHHVEQETTSTSNDVVVVAATAAVVATPNGNAVATEVVIAEQTQQQQHHVEDNKPITSSETTAPSVAAVPTTTAPNGVSKPVPAATTATTSTAPSTQPATPAAPKSWAALLASNNNKQPAVAIQSTQNATTQTQQHQQPQPQQSNNATTSTTSTTSATPAINPKDSHKEGCTIYVNYASVVKQPLEVPQLRMVFGQYGTITHLRVLPTYAFVEYALPDHVQNVLAHIKNGGVLAINENPLKVEEKRANMAGGKQFKHKKDKPLDNKAASPDNSKPQSSPQTSATSTAAADNKPKHKSQPAAGSSSSSSSSSSTQQQPRGGPRSSDGKPAASSAGGAPKRQAK
ncbi:hypothetical protein SAMD00019534_085690 [Acytostelium subglobosum LB1]|uniref:hypothetical protein n=1 Tax=Acytostelium subglobosum LB1 TaxID=1410327 RepID=UPI000644D073|nr:hypothetical protein SAMD00019534_085690 [Acytostelium subglobosum LB1]GAM25394.1 hypothetical protein SAMD00019534_085690 [Acytostelium subglobosum LB1]|eukprot:XP_012751914.1 hypothetical protein SAMD00019534_085690 [Acytostelium subglobosum LB1]